MLPKAVSLLLAFALAACSHAPSGGPAQEDAALWRFDRLHRVGGLPVRAEGEPRMIVTKAGPAVAFDGVDDALFLDNHPLAGAVAFTVEAIFRPDGGPFEQRWLHLAEAGGAEHAAQYPPVDPRGSRFLFEIRVVGTSWYLDAFMTGPGYNKTLMFPEKTFPLGRWYHVAQTYDGRTYRSYVNGALQGEAEVPFTPQGPGYASVGTRINRRDYFRGAVHTARFTRRALAPEQFLKLDPRLEGGQ